MRRYCAALTSLGLTILLVSSLAWGQATTSLRGTVTDPSGAVIPGCTVTLTSPETGFVRTTTSGPDGVYEFLVVPPGTYRLEVEAKGFRKYVREGLELLVKLPATANVQLTVGGETQTVEVTAGAPLLNTSDATIGVAMGERQVEQLPLEARQVAGLYSLQPGVVFLGNRTDINLDVDTRAGAVNGAHSDQSNITIDGLDANDQGSGYAFTSVLRMNPDAIAEFRVTTTNYNADQGRSSGAQVSLVTKSGTNDFHGSLYEYHRNTVTSANDYFIKLAELGSGEKNQAPKLIRNIFGGSLGGPIKRDRAFFFLNFDGRRDAQEESVVRNVPTATMRKGMIGYQDENGGVTVLTPQDITDMDPLGLGPNPVMLSYFNSFPLPNDSSVGDGLNYSGYRFPGRVHRRFDTYIARLDYQLTEDGRHTLFVRGNLQPYDFDSGVPLFPGQQSLQATEGFSKGVAVGYTTVIHPNLVNQFRWGWTRQSEDVLGNSTQPWIYFRNLNDNYVARTHGLILPVNNFVDDLTWTKGTHSFSFGTNIRIIRNSRNSLQSSFSDGVTNASWTADAAIAGTGGYFDPAAYGFPGVDPNFANSYDFPLIAMLGAVTEVDAQYNYDKQGHLLAQGAPIPRHFGLNEYEFYAQDAWRIRPNFTLTYGLRWEIAGAPWETTGLQVIPNVNMGQWFNQRAINMDQGIGSNQDPLLEFELGGPANGRAGFYPTAKKDFAPRLALAYSPQPTSGMLKRLFGEGGKTTIRAGFGMVYDRIGMGLMNSFDQNGSFGLSTLLTNPAGVQTLDCAPRLTNVNVIPTQGCGGTIFVAAPSGGFPQTPPSTLDTGGFSISWGLDNSIKTPYSYMLDFSITRELARNTTLEVSYVGHLSHRLLAQEDLAMPLDWVDPKTGIDYFTAAARLSSLAYAGKTTADITNQLVGPTAQFWTDLFGPPPAGGYPIVDAPYGTASAAQSAFDLFSDPVNGFLGNETTGLAVLDLYGYPVTPVTGLNTFFNRQYSSLYAWRSMANANYHALQLTLRRRMSAGVQFDFNYTFSKSMDLMSDAERVGPWSGLGGNIINSWAPNQMRAVSDFDTTHQINTNFIVEMPFGRGRTLGRNAHGFAEALIGGWQTSGILRWTTGFPVNIFNGYYWATNWQLGGQAVVVGKAPATQTTKNPDGTVNMFSDPTAAYNGFRFALPGESGSRNPIRGDGFFSWDMSLAKRWKMPYAENHSLQFRWEVFNVPNSTRFNVQSNPPELDEVTAFGKYTGLLTNPRIMQFVLRYEF
jgi:Carboxypeptidase regulatory-like domain